MEEVSFRRCRYSRVKDLRVCVVPHGVEMIVATHLNDDLFLILTEQVEVDVVWVGEPHRVVV